MSSRASGGALAACLITAAIVGFAGGGYFGSQSGGDSPSASESPAPDDTTPVGETPGDGETPGETETPAGDGALTLSAAQTEVSPGGQIDFTGAIDPPEEGVQLRLERSVDGGDWETFPLNNQPVTGADGTFSTYASTSQSGTNAFRLVREDDDSVVSNEVQVAVG
ncbi:hypothetical protein E1262_19720 [Jiangella aurantiaca]|uniref:Bacterial spore germination immunoglobulin-like domain-containing protein n=1 Tax=Jiangella aurantiaca TaxID=2530373 RepID=A0A4R5A568_9ACTN|nr:hypothetical protein [Jiangella aurantiaca]TDD67168.1 hypothetical protein E1262_19720 [Jiangella aurantiaca]